MNPYADFIRGRDPLLVIAATSDRLQELVTGLGARAEVQPSPGKWSAREVICHLADTEMVFAFRLRQALAEPYHVIQPFDQDRWAARYEIYSIEAALALFAAVRHWNHRLITSLNAEEWKKKLTHPERGEMELGVIVETMAGHDLNHISQLEKILG